MASGDAQGKGNVLIHLTSIQPLKTEDLFYQQLNQALLHREFLCFMDELQRRQQEYQMRSLSVITG